MRSREAGGVQAPAQNGFVTLPGSQALEGASALFPYCSLWSPEAYETQQAEPITFFRGLRLVMSHGPYIKLIAGFLFTSLAFMVSGGLTCSA